MKYPDFDICFTICQEVMRELIDQDLEATVVFGRYIPDTPMNTWDERWIALKSSNPRGFVHFWIETKGRIIDHAAQQFGGPPLRIVPKPDGRYYRMGRVEGEAKIQERGHINWNSK